jgi:putative ABC transport system substrate-binding protein
MNRRNTVLALLALGATSRIAGAQAATPVIGVLSTNASDAYGASMDAAFAQGLRESGVEVGRDVTLEYRRTNGKYDALPALAEEMVKRGVAVIFAASLPSALAVKAATSTIPVVFVMGADPVKLGVVASLPRPGGNITGISQLYGELGAKRLEMLRELVPGAKSVGVLSNPKNPNAKDHLDSLKSAAKAIGLPIEALNASSAADIEAAFAGMARHRINALVIADDPFFTTQREWIVALTGRHRLPTIHYTRAFVEIGGLVSYGSDARDNYRLAGGYAARMLRGAKPSDLPVLQPTKFELVVNLKTAKALKLKIPQTLLVRADRVIE